MKNNTESRKDLLEMGLGKHIHLRHVLIHTHSSPGQEWPCCIPAPNCCKSFQLYGVWAGPSTAGSSESPRNIFPHTLISHSIIRAANLTKAVVSRQSKEGIQKGFLSFEYEHHHHKVGG